MVESHNLRRVSVYRALGGGSVADILLWRWRSATLLVLISATFLWVLFKYGGYNVFSFIANVLLLLVAILFFWAKAASLLNRPLPPIPDLEISDASVEKAAEVLRVWINRILSTACGIAVGANFRVLLQVAVTSWVVSYIGSVCDFLTLVYIGVLLSLSLPVMYEKYHDRIHDRFYQMHRVIQLQWDKIDGSILSKIPFPMYRKKKTQ